MGKRGRVVEVRAVPASGRETPVGLAADPCHTAGALTPGGVAAGHSLLRTPNCAACGRVGPCAGAHRLRVSRPVTVGSATPPGRALW